MVSERKAREGSAALDRGGDLKGHDKDGPGGG